MGVSNASCDEKKTGLEIFDSQENSSREIYANLEYDYYSLSSVVFSAFGSRVVWPCFGSLSFGKVSSKAWPRGAVHEVISSR